MPILVNCPCGWGTLVQDEHAGKRSKCPKCHAPVVVPRAEATLPDIDDVKLVDDEPRAPVSEKSRPPVPAEPVPSGRGDPDVIDDVEVVKEPRRPTKPAPRKSSQVPAGEDDVVTSGIEVVQSPRRPSAERPGPRAADEPIELELDEEQPKPKKPRPVEADEDEEEPRPPTRKRKKQRRVVDDEPRPPLIAVSAGVASGFLLLVGGIVWLAIALANDRFSPRALVTVLVGLFMLARGFLGLEEE